MEREHSAGVAVIGSGPAGCAAAHALRGMGHRPVVFEANDHVGGRASTVREGGFTLDTGASLLLSNYDRTFSLVRELRGDDELIRYRGKSGFHDGKRLHLVRLESRLAYLRLRLLGTRDKLRFAYRGAMLSLRGGPDMFDLVSLAEADDGETVADWGRRSFGEAGYEYAIRPSIEGLTGFSCEVASAATAKAFLHAGRGRGLRLFALKSGTGALCDSLLEGSERRLGEPVRSLDESASGVVVRTDGSSAGFAGAIVATDAQAAAKLLPPGGVRDALGRTRYAANIHVALGFEEDPWPDAPADAVFPVGPGEHTDGSLALLSRKWQGLVPTGAQIASVYFGDSAAQGLDSDADAIARAQETTRTFLGSCPPPSFEWVFRRENAVPVPEPGGFSRLRSAVEAISPRVRLAGDYLFHQTAEGAIRSGERAAKDLGPVLTT